MGRSKVSDLADLGQALKGLLFGEQCPSPLKKRGDERKCTLCLRGNDNAADRNVAALSEGFSDQVIKAVFTALLVPNGDYLVESQPSPRILWLCGECTLSLTTLTDLILQLEELRKEFNGLRRRVGHQVIVTSLGKGVGTYGKWEEEVRKVEDRFPSCAVKNTAVLLPMLENEFDALETANLSSPPGVDNEIKVESEEVDNDFEHFCAEPDELVAQWKDDVKLKQIPAVVLQRLASEDEREVEIPRRLEIKVIVPGSAEEEDISMTSDLGDGLDNDSDVQDEPVQECRQLRPRRKQNVNMRFKDFYTDDPLRTRNSDSHSSDEANEHEVMEVTSSDEDDDDESVHRAKRRKKDSLLLFKCPRPRCSSSFTRADHLAGHLKIFHPAQKKALPLPRSLQCDQCDATFRRPNDVKSHVRMLHGDKPSKKRIQCPKCPKSFEWQAQLTSHKRVAHDPLKCPSCPATFTKIQKLRDHCLSVHEFVPGPRKASRVCNICNRKFPKAEHCLRHQVKDHAVCLKEMQCTHCDMTFLDPLAFKNHVLRRHFLGSKDEGHLQCSLCLQFFHAQWGLHKHREAKHSGGQKDSDESQESANGQIRQIPEGKGHRAALNIHCFLCKDSRRYSTAEELAEHSMTSEHQEILRSKVSVHCNLCKVNFKGSTSALQAHLTSTEHLKEAKALKEVDLSSFCVPCRKPFEGPKALGVHLNRLSHLKVCEVFRLNPRNVEAEPRLEVPSKCPSCSKMFEFQSALDSHVLKFHNPSGYSCKFCPAKFHHRAELKRHRASHPDRISKPHVCDKCGKAFESFHGLTFHLRNSHGDTPRSMPHVCDSCGKAFKSRDRLENHLLACKDAPSSFPCLHCTATFKTHQRLRRHLYLLHYEEFVENSPHSCPVCCLVYPSSSDLTSHMTASHGNMTCDTCGKRFLTKAHLGIHKRVHTKEKPYECSICFQRFVQNGTLKSHLERHAKGKPSSRVARVTLEQFSCTSCEEKFGNRYALDKHAVVCSAAPESVDCPHCGAQFKTPQRVRRHLYLVHYEEFLEETPCSCPICYTVVPSPEELAPHMTSTHGKMTCDTCGKRFLSKAHLSIHDRIHTKEQPFACTICSRRFNLRANLKEHEMRHKGEKKHRCLECDASFWRKKELEKHVGESH